MFLLCKNNNKSPFVIFYYLMQFVYLDSIATFFSTVQAVESLLLSLNTSLGRVLQLPPDA